jgi:hypothetical protein
MRAKRLHLILLLGVLLPSLCSESAWCVGNIKKNVRWCCALECGACGGTGCYSFAEGFTCCTGSLTDACETPEQHTCLNPAYVVPPGPPEPPPAPPAVPVPPLAPPALPTPPSVPPCHDIVDAEGACVADANKPAAYVTLGADGRLVYAPNSVGDNIVDFAHVGFEDDLSALPDVPAVLTVSPSADGGAGEDDAPRIQAALDAVSAAAPATSGFRGAVQLAAGTFRVATPLYIHAGGVVLRGAGADPTSASFTQLLATGTSQDVVISVTGTASVEEHTASSTLVTDSYVPVGAQKLHVASVAAFSVGMLVVVKWLPNHQWIHSIGRAAGLTMPSSLSDDTAPSASVDHLEAQAAPAHPRAPAELLGGSPWLQELDSGRPKYHRLCQAWTSFRTARRH